MTNNVKIKTPDVEEILDIKIKTSNSHVQLAVLANENYDSVLSKIAARSPTLNEKQALDAAVSPSLTNPYVTYSELTLALSSKIPWKTVGLVGSGSDYEGNTDAIFTTAFAGSDKWFQIREGTFTFSSTVAIPAGVRVIGTSASATQIVGNIAAPLFTVASDSYLSYMAVEQQNSTASSIEVVGNNVGLENLILTSVVTGYTINANAVSGLKIFNCVSQVGQLPLTVSDSFLHGCLFDAPVIDALLLDNCDNISLTSSIFKNGVFKVDTSTSIRALANHFNDGTNLIASPTTLLRANTPNSYNNEVDDFANLLSYIGSPSVLTLDPPFSNNYGGPPGEDLTARASALDLLTQWRYEERNFQLMADTEPMTVAWAPSTNTLSTSGAMRLVTSHRSSYWNLATIVATVIPDGWALYYVLDRNLNAVPITLSPVLAPLGSIANDRDNRQVWVLAFAIGTTLWWRGGGGSRFPGTGGQTGTYFVDGSSKSLLDYLGAVDYNDSDPNYSNNFAGVQGENLVTRIGKTDVLIKRLFEYSNLGTYLSDGGNITVEPGPGTKYTVELAGSFYMAFPHVAGRITATSLSWDLEDGELVYFTLNQGGLAGVDTPITSSTVVAAGSLPLPDAYPLTTKYFVFAYRIGTSIYLWDDSELPVGGRYPVPIGRAVIPDTAPVTLPDNTYYGPVSYNFAPADVNIGTEAITVAAHGLTNGMTVTFMSTGGLPTGLANATTYFVVGATTNTFQVSLISGGSAVNLTGIGSGTHTVTTTAKHFRWEGLSLAVATGMPLNINNFADQLKVSVGLTDLAEGEGLVVTHSWNFNASPRDVTVQKVTTLSMNTLNQNQFLWVQRRSNNIVFSN